MSNAFITESLLETGVDIAVVAKMAGHASVTIMKRYDRRGGQAKAKAAALLCALCAEIVNLTIDISGQ